METIRNPVQWTSDQLKHAVHAAEAVGHSIRGSDVDAAHSQPVVRQISVDDIRDALTKGLDDFRTFRTDVAFICIIYPLAGLAMAWFAFQAELLPLLFPLGSGFALVGPVAAVGLYEMSRRRERGEKTTWANAFGMVGSPSFGAIVVLGLGLLLVFLAWLLAAESIYALTLGPQPPASISAFVNDVLTTPAGWAMIVLGIGVGFVFAVVVLVVSVVSFPMLIDRDVGLAVAVQTSVRASLANPRPIAIWGMIVAGGLVLGSIPLFLGLIFVMPVLGHATWHLYRKLVAA
jgi:uncharacterized membrane protein